MNKSKNTGVTFNQAFIKEWKPEVWEERKRGSSQSHQDLSKHFAI